jgi:hypothetical protein
MVSSAVYYSVLHDRPLCNLHILIWCRHDRITIRKFGWSVLGSVVVWWAGGNGNDARWLWHVGAGHNEQCPTSSGPSRAHRLRTDARARPSGRRRRGTNPLVASYDDVTQPCSGVGVAAPRRSGRMEMTTKMPLRSSNASPLSFFLRTEKAKAFQEESWTSL